MLFLELYFLNYFVTYCNALQIIVFVIQVIQKRRQKITVTFMANKLWYLPYLLIKFLMFTGNIRLTGRLMTIPTLTMIVIIILDMVTNLYHA